MRLEEFRRLAEAWGGDVTRWPDGVRAQAEWLATSHEAAAILAEARAVDRMITQAAPDIAQRRVDDAIHGVVTRLAREAPRRASAPSWLRRFVPSAAIVCAVAMGMVIGLADLMDDEASQDDMRTVLTQLFDSSPFQQNWFVQ